MRRLEECGNEKEVKRRILGGDAFYVNRWIKCWGDIRLPAFLLIFLYIRD